MKSRRRNIEIYSMSFLDVISCGFGAVILLLVLNLGLEPATVERLTAGVREKAAEIDGSRDDFVTFSYELGEQLRAGKERLEETRQRLADVSRRWQQTQNQGVSARTRQEQQAKVEKRLRAVLQSMNEETRRLIQQPTYQQPAEDAIIGGIPVDSEYIIFVIDTSGSMTQLAWPMVIKKVKEVLKVYPTVKGIQVLNDMGKYMFSGYSRRWIPDTPARRREVLRRLQRWNSFSNSSPVEGILYAVRRFFKKDRKISLYVFGDDFTGGGIDGVLSEVLRINKGRGSGEPRVRIHAFGFPVLFLHPKGKRNRVRFAHLMRLLAEQNAGSFVGLTSLK